MISFIEEALVIFVTTIRTQYCQFSGRTSRKGYWYYYVTTISISVPLMILEAIFELPPILSMVYMVGTFLPGLGLGFRRLHDVNKSAWNSLWIMLPFFGPIYLVYLAVKKGDFGPNDFGPVPE